MGSQAGKAADRFEGRGLAGRLELQQGRGGENGRRSCGMRKHPQRSRPRRITARWDRPFSGHDPQRRSQLVGGGGVSSDVRTGGNLSARFHQTVAERIAVALAFTQRSYFVRPEKDLFRAPWSDGFWRRAETHQAERFVFLGGFSPTVRRGYRIAICYPAFRCVADQHCRSPTRTGTWRYRDVGYSFGPGP